MSRFDLRAFVRTAVALALVVGFASASRAVVVHRWDFNHGAFDSVGNAHGTLVGNTGGFSNGKLDLTGNVDGMNSNMENGGSYVDLPNNLIAPLGMAGQFSVETWFIQPTNPTYSFMWSFGADGSFSENTSNGGGEYLGFLAPIAEATTRGVIPDPPTPGVFEEYRAGGGGDLPIGELSHLVVTLNVNDDTFQPPAGEPSGSMHVYLNGEYLGGNFIAPYIDWSTFHDINSWIGRAVWNDPLYDGTIEEFAIYNTALSEAQIDAAYAAGPVPAAAPGLPGDVNGDGDVTVADWNVIKGNMFTPQGSYAAGDITFDGFVNHEDFRVWKTAYLAAGGSAAIFGDAVPEPAAVALLALAVGAVLVLRRRVAAVAVCVAACSAAGVWADTTWTNETGDNNYANGGNWLSDDGFTGVPDITFDGVARILGGTVNLTANDLPIAPFMHFGGETPTVLNITNGGALVMDGSFDPGASQIAGTTVNLNNGSLTTHNLWYGDGNRGKILTISGNSQLIVAEGTEWGTMILPNYVTVRGPSATIEAPNTNGHISFFDTIEYTAVITGSDHSTFRAGGDINVRGTLALEFSGYTPQIGDSWDILSAGRELVGERLFDLDTSSVTGLPAGAGFVQSIAPGPGGVGEVLQVGLIRKLNVTVNRTTGEVRVVNPAAGPAGLSGYTVASAGGNLGASFWNSLDDRNLGTFVENAAPTGSLLGETATADYNLAAGSSITLGNIFKPTPTSIGEDIEDLQISYTLASGLVVPVDITYTGSGRNNLAMTIDRATGAATIVNDSTFNIQIDGYTLTSQGGALSPTGWNSFDDRNMAGWEESNATATRLAEFNISTAMSIAAGGTFSLGNIFNPAAGMPTDVGFSYLLNGQSNLIDAFITYTTMAALAGDYNKDNVVNAADYTVWRDMQGLTGANLAADGTGDGVVNAADYNLWRANFGRSSAGSSSLGSQAVPEPSTVGLMGLALVACCSQAKNRVRSLTRLLRN